MFAQGSNNGDTGVMTLSPSQDNGPIVSTRAGVTEAQIESLGIRARIDDTSYKNLVNGADLSVIDNRSGIDVKVLITRDSAPHQEFSVEKQLIMKTKANPKGIELGPGEYATFPYSECITIKLRTISISNGGQAITDSDPYVIEEGNLGRFNVEFVKGSKRSIQLTRPVEQPEDISPNYISLHNKVKQFNGKIFYSVKSGNHNVCTDVELVGDFGLLQVEDLYSATLYYKRVKCKDYEGNLPVKFDPRTSVLFIVEENGYAKILVKRKDIHNGFSTL
jgi:hypothetical protein